MTTDTASCAVDPHQLLKALSTLLTPQGEIKSPDNVAKILSLMKSAKKLVSRCIYINILRATQDEEVMNKFISDGGWELLNGWLQDAKESNNTPVILELIKVFKQLPVTIEILKKNNTAKLIKQLSKGVDEKLKEVANELVDSWLSVIRHSQDGKEKPVVKKKPKIKKVEKKDSPSTDNKEESKTDSSDKVSKASKRTVSNNHNSDAKHSERTKEGPSKAKTPRRDSIDDDIPLSRLKKMDSKSPSGKEKSPGKTEEEKPVRRRTAKVPQTKFRSTGLEKDAQLPPIKIKKKTVVPPAVTNKPKPEKLLPVKREGPIFSKSLTPPDKKPKTVTSPTQNKIKLIPAKAKSHVQESSMFMSALNAPAPVVRKKRRPSNKPTSPTTNKQTSHPMEKEKRSKSSHHGSHSSSHAAEKTHAEAPEEPKPEPPKFGFYAAIQQEEEKTDSKETSEKKEGDVKSEDSAAKTEVNGAKKKKSVKWKPESELVEIKYFELDATERVNVNKAKDFRDAAQMEMMMERQAVKNAMRGGSSLFNEDGMSEQHQTVEYFPWPKLIKIDLSMIQTVDYGCNSKERDIQKQREMVVLAEIYFDKNMVPETPQEPEPESYNPKEPKKIPLEDETAVETTQGSIPPFQPDYQPQHQHHPPQQQQQPFANLPPGFPQNLQNLDIPPDMAQILQQIPMQGMQGGGPPGPQGQQQHMQGNEQPSPNPTIRNVQNLLSSIMDNQGSTSQEDLTNKLREMLEPFKNQLPGAMGMGQHQQNQGMPPPDGMPPPFGNPGEFGPPPGMGGMPPRGALLPPPPPPFPDGPGPGPGPHPRGMGPHFGGPGPHFQPGPQFQGGPGGGPNDGWGGPNDGWGGENQQMHGGPPMGRGRGRGMGGRGRGRGRGEGGQGRGQGGRPVCRHFMSPKGCMRGNSCMFYHPGVHGPPLQNNGPPPPLLPNPE